MGISASDVIPLSHARANFSELAEEVKGGAEKIITKNGESYIALIDASRLDYYHQLERERIHLLLIDDASKGTRRRCRWQGEGRSQRHYRTQASA
jgi:prevent-host-death family protein